MAEPSEPMTPQERLLWAAREEGRCSHWKLGTRCLLSRGHAGEHDTMLARAWAWDEEEAEPARVVAGAEVALTEEEQEQIVHAVFRGPSGSLIPTINRILRGHVLDASAACAEDPRLEKVRALLDEILAALAPVQAQTESTARLRSKHCGCAWCCASTPPEKRGEMHQRTCQPHPAPAQSVSRNAGRGEGEG